jgi:hypothetical protein
MGPGRLPVLASTLVMVMVSVGALLSMVIAQGCDWLIQSRSQQISPQRAFGPVHYGGPD